MNRQRGLTLIEALLAMAITSTLLVALAAVFHASAMTVNANSDYFRSTQTARLALGRITTEIRRADAVEIDSSRRSIRIIPPAGELSAGEVYREFRYEPATHVLTLQIFDQRGLAGPVNELADHVTAFSVGAGETRDEPGDAANPNRCLPVSITCTIGGASVTLAGSVSPRRAYNHGQ